MIIRKLAVVAAIACLAGGASWAQSKPNYDEALSAVVEGGCERTETERYIRFFCEEGEAFWYFTHEGTPEHQAYFATAAFGPYGRPILQPDRMTSSSVLEAISRGRPVDAKSQEEARERMKAWQAWVREVVDASRRDASEMQRPKKRDRGKLYPLDPS